MRPPEACAALWLALPGAARAETLAPVPVEIVSKSATLPVLRCRAPWVLGLGQGLDVPQAVFSRDGTALYALVLPHHEPAGDAVTLVRVPLDGKAPAKALAVFPNVSLDLVSAPGPAQVGLVVGQPGQSLGWELWVWTDGHAVRFPWAWEAQRSSVERPTFDPSGTHLAFSVEARSEPENRPAALALLTLASGELRRIPVPEAYAPFAFSPDGTRVAFGGASKENVVTYHPEPRDDAGTLSVFDTATGALLAHPEARGDGRAVGFSPDGTRVAMGSFLARVTLWDAAFRPVFSEVVGGTEDGFVAFAPKRPVFVVSGGALYGRDTQTGAAAWEAEIRLPRKGGSYPVRPGALGFAGDAGLLLFTGDADGFAVAQLDVSTGKPLPLARCR